MTDDINKDDEAKAALRDRKANIRRAAQVAVNAAKRAGLKRFKEENPGTGTLLLSPQGTVYYRKPDDFSAFAQTVVSDWLSDPATLEESNTAVMQKFQKRFPEHTFSERGAYNPLRKDLQEKLRTSLAEHGVGLPPNVETLAEIKKVLRIHHGSKGTKAHVSIDCVVTAEYFGPFKIEDHKGRNCIRLTHSGRRSRIYLDDLVALSIAMAKEPVKNPPAISYEVVTGLAPANGKPAENRDTPPTSTDVLAILATNAHALAAGLAPNSLSGAEKLDNDSSNSAVELSTAERIAALKAHYSPQPPPQSADDSDPLCDL